MPNNNPILWKLLESHVTGIDYDDEYAKRMPLNPIKTPQNSIGTPDDINLPHWPSHPLPWKSTLVVLWRKIKMGTLHQMREELLEMVVHPSLGWPTDEVQVDAQVAVIELRYFQGAALSRSTQIGLATEFGQLYPLQGERQGFISGYCWLTRQGCMSEARCNITDWSHI